MPASERLSKRTTKKVRKRKKLEPVYVEPTFPHRLQVASFVWALVGWAIAAAMPHLALFPLIGVLNYVLPAVTVGFIGTNLWFAVRELNRGVHPLSLLVVTGLQICLFTTLFFQFYAHLGAELFDVSGPTAPWQWFQFSLAHALRASDVLDFVEAYGLKIQPIKHDSAVVAVFVIVYHIVIDVFVLAVLWQIISRFRERMMDDDILRDFVRQATLWTFVLWLVVWLVVAMFIRRWMPIDVILWPLDNILRVFDFADIMDSFDIRLHAVPRDALSGTLAFFARIWVAIGIAILIGKRKEVTDHRLATPPDEDPVPYWWRRVQAMAGVVAAVLVVGVFWHIILGDNVPDLAQTATTGTPEQSRAALAGLRRLGPAGAEAVPLLVSARSASDPAMRDNITRTLGYLGDQAADSLAQIALKEDGQSGAIAVEALGHVGKDAAPAVAKIWKAAPSGPVKDRADAVLRQFGSDAVPVLMEATNLENADAHYQWFGELDRGWRSRVSPNPVVKSLQQLPDVLSGLAAHPRATEAKPLLATLAGCGSAARQALPYVRPYFHTGSAAIQEATAVMRTMGPSIMPILLKEGGNLDTNSAALGLIMDANMWDPAALKDEQIAAAFRSLLFRAERPGLRKTAFNALKNAGPNSPHLVPLLVSFLGDEDEERRAEARKTLDRVDPGWKKNPALNKAIVGILPRLTSMPKKEADELDRILGALPASEADYLVYTLTSSPARPKIPLGVRLEQRARPGESPADVRNREESEYWQSVHAYRNAVFGAARRFGPRLRAAVPALQKAMQQPGMEADLRNRLDALIQSIESAVVSEKS